MNKEPGKIITVANRLFGALRNMLIRKREISKKTRVTIYKTI